VAANAAAPNLADSQMAPVGQVRCRPHALWLRYPAGGRADPVDAEREHIRWLVEAAVVAVELADPVLVVLAEVGQLLEDGVDAAFDKDNAPLITPEMKAKVEAARKDIIAGKIKVHDYMSDNACPAT